MSAASFDTLGTAGDFGPSDFPGCESFHLPASEIDRYEGRLEFWDGHTETGLEGLRAHVHSSMRQPCQAAGADGWSGSRDAARLAVSSCFGSADLVRLDATGRKRWLMQADQVLYLHPERSRLKGPAIDVDEDPLPDVVLEVDHTTDVRRRKLDIYKESGFPEIWVLVPWEASVRAPGLAIHVRREDGYREEAASRAFPGWKAEEIHRALTETPLSETAWRALERTALAMGAREGTTPDDDPLMRSMSTKLRAQGQALGRMELVAVALGAKGIEVASDFAQYRTLLAGLPIERLKEAVLACTSEADFRRRIREAAE